MNERYPRLRVRSSHGGYDMREGVNISFFMRRHHAEVLEPVLRALEVYRRATGHDSLTEYFDMEGWPKPLVPGGWEYIHEQMLSGRNGGFELADSNPALSDYRFIYSGKWLDEPLFHARNPNQTSGVSFWLPTEYLEGRGATHVRSLAMELASLLPFHSGYASMAFSFSEMGFIRTSREIRRLVWRYLAMDASQMESTARLIGTKVMGAYWLTFLADPVLKELGGVEALRARLHSPETTVEPLGPERAVVTLGEWPAVGDVESSESLEPYR